jgi:hypothetical protein
VLCSVCVFVTRCGMSRRVFVLGNFVEGSEPEESHHVHLVFSLS